MTAQPISATSHESQAKQFKPVHRLAATNLNDIRLFLYEWFIHFEHAAPQGIPLAKLIPIHFAKRGAPTALQSV